MMAKLHQNKEISKAVEYALSVGFRIVEAGGSAHPAFFLYCPEASREGCMIPVYSTPRSAENHANKIRRDVEKCLELHPRPEPEGTP